MSTDRDREIEERLQWLEKAVLVLSAEPGTPALPPRPRETATDSGASAGTTDAPHGVPQEVVALIEGGHDIRAIDAYRKATGAGVKEAKKVVDQLKRR